MKALKDNPDIDDSFIPALRNEIKRLQELNFKNKKKNIKPLPKTLKCSTISCKRGGNLDTKNTDAYAQCSMCEGCEHFYCVNTKKERKLNVLNGSEKFVCTLCFAQNPKKVALERDTNIVKPKTKADVE